MGGTRPVALGISTCAVVLAGMCCITVDIQVPSLE